MSFPATVQTSVSRHAISKVTRLFNGSLSDILNLCGITSHAFS